MSSVYLAKCKSTKNPSRRYAVKVLRRGMPKASDVDDRMKKEARTPYPTYLTPLSYPSHNPLSYPSLLHLSYPSLTPL